MTDLTDVLVIMTKVDWGAAARDLLLGGACVACGRGGASLCGDCARLLPARAMPCWPTPSPAGLARPWATGEYAEALRALILAHKEWGIWSLGTMSG